MKIDQIILREVTNPMVTVRSSKPNMKIINATIKVLDDFQVPISMYSYQRIVELSSNEIRLSNYLRQILVDYLNKFD